MSFDESAPRHGHRTPAELAEDEFIEALRGDASRIRFVKRSAPDRHEVVTLHSSRLFPVLRNQPGDSKRGSSRETADESCLSRAAQRGRA